MGCWGSGRALWLSNGVVQMFLLGTLFTQDTFVLIKNLASSMSIVPYFFVAGFGLLIALGGDTYHGWSRRRRLELCIAAIATTYAIGLILAAATSLWELVSGSMTLGGTAVVH